MLDTDSCDTDIEENQMKVDGNNLNSHTFRPQNLQPSQAQSETPAWKNQVSRVSDFFREKKVFKIVLVYDNSFCALNGNKNRIANQVIQAMLRKVEIIYRKTLAAISLEDIKGNCNHANDPYEKPRDLESCLANSTDCSRSSMILQNLREYWRFRTDYRRRDALYLITGYDAGNGVLGAAFRGAACNSDYSYGWIHGANPTVLAHEIGHTLDAPHEQTGIMQAYIDDSAEPFLSAATIDEVNEFLVTVWDSWCLGSWDRYYSYGATTLVGLASRDHLAEGSGIAFAEVSHPGQDDLVFLEVGKNRPSDSIFFSFAQNLRKEPGSGFRIETWSKLFIIPDTKGNHAAGGGVAFGNIRSPKSKDLIIAYVGFPRTVYYKIGFNVTVGGKATSGWTSSFKVPGRLGKRVTCLGISVGDITGTGRKDLLIAYVDIEKKVNYARYIFGYDLGSDGAIKGGWSNPMEIPGWLGYITRDISVALYDTSGSGRSDVIIHSNERALGISRGSFRIGRDLDDLGQVSGLWSTTIPAPGSLLVSVMPRITGGIAIGNIGKEKKPTTVILQSVSFPSETTVVSYLELGFDLLKAAEAEVNVSTIKNVLRSPVSKCDECYNDTKSGSCKQKFSVCSVTEHAFPLETVSLAVSRTIVPGDGSEQEQGPDTGTIFCEGFHDLFVEKQSDACRSDVGTEDVMSAGAAGVIRDVIVAEAGSGTIAVEYSIKFDTRKASTFIDEKERTIGPGKLPQSVHIKIVSSSKIRREVIKSAVQKFTRRKGYQFVFKNVDYMVENTHGRSWIVIIQFNALFRKEFFKEDALKRVAG